MRNSNISHPPSHPLISVITICRNAAEFIKQCMGSVIAQQYDDFEYVVIDGGSTDGTQSIIEHYATHLAYWHSKPDRGLSHAFNLGVEHSRGKWLLFLNSDDCFANPNVLGQVGEHLKTYQDADVVFGQVAVVARDNWKRVVGGPYGQKFNWGKFLFMNTIPHQGAFINRAFFSRVGLYSEKLKLASDYELFLRAGPNINARFIPLLISYMRDGGISKVNPYKCIAEWHRARLINAIEPKWKLRIIYAYLVCRASVGMFYRRLIR